MKVYVARDKGQGLFIYINKPVKRFLDWKSPTNIYIPVQLDELPEGVNPQWEDEEPIELEMSLSIPKK